jgi:hypothetical protein
VCSTTALGPTASTSVTPPRVSSSGPRFGYAPVIERAALMTTSTPVASSPSALTRSMSAGSMIAMSEGPRRLARSFVRLSRRAVP